MLLFTSSRYSVDGGGGGGDPMSSSSSLTLSVFCCGGGGGGLPALLPLRMVVLCTKVLFVFLNLQVGMALVPASSQFLHLLFYNKGQIMSIVLVLSIAMFLSLTFLTAR